MKYKSILSNFYNLQKIIVFSNTHLNDYITIKINFA